MSNWWAHATLVAPGSSSQTSNANASGLPQQQPPQSMQSQLLLINELLEKERRAGEKIFNEVVSSFRSSQSPLQGAPLFYPPGTVEGHVKCEGHPLSRLNITLVNVRFEDEAVLLASSLTNEEGRYKVSTEFQWNSSPIVHLQFGHNCGENQGKALLEDYYIPTDDLYWSDGQSGAFLYDVDLGGAQPKSQFLPLDD